MVVWDSRDLTTGTEHVAGQRYSSSGSGTGPELLPGTGAELCREPAVASLPLGKLVIAFQCRPTKESPFTVRWYRFDASGSKLGGYAIPLGSEAGNAYADVAALPDGTFVLTWTRIQPDQTGDVIVQRFNSNGSPKGNEVMVNTFTQGNQDYSKVAALSNARFVVVWESKDQDGSDFGVFARVFDF